MPLDQGDADPETAGKRGRLGSRFLKLTLIGGAVALLVREDLRNRLLNVLLGAEEEFDYSTLTEPPAPSEPPEVRSEPFVRSAAHESADQEPERDDAPQMAEPDEAPAWEFTPQPVTVESEPDRAQAEAPQVAEPADEPGWEYTPRPAPLEDEADRAQAQTPRFEEAPDGAEDPQAGEQDEEAPESAPAESSFDEPSPPVTEPSRGPTSIAPSPADWRAAAAEHEQDADDEPERNPAGAEDASVEPPAPPVGWWQPTRPGFEPR